MKRLPLVVCLGFIAGFVASSCGGPRAPACSPATCEGCCDSFNVCKAGEQESSCGVGGLACNVCSGGQVCSARACILPATFDAGTDAGSDAGIDGGEVDAGTPRCAATAVTCTDQATLNLDLKTTVAPASILNTAEDGGFKSTIDATGGGSPPTTSFVYAKFTATGLQKVSLSDEAALGSLDWDIAFRRFVIRLNGGSSGPSCVGAASTPSGTPFDAVTAVPSGASYVLDDFLGPPPTCTFKDDGSGLGSSPSTALANTAASYYVYASCVKMTNRVFVAQTRLGRNVKVHVTGYYATEAAQTNCNNGATPGAAGGTIRMRWSFLD